MKAILLRVKIQRVVGVGSYFYKDCIASLSFFYVLKYLSDIKRLSKKLNGIEHYHTVPSFNNN